MKNKKTVFLSDQEMLTLYLFLHDEIQREKDIINDPNSSDESFDEATTNLEIITPIKNKLFHYLKQNISEVNGMPLAEFLKQVE